MSDDDLPEAFHAADRAAALGQRQASRWLAAQLVALLVAAVGGAVAMQTAALIAILAFLASLLFTLKLATDHPEQRWYQGRAAAESVKSLAWTFAVGGDPFPMELYGPDAERRFLDRVRGVLHTVADSGGLAPVTRGGAQLTPGMRALRAAPLAARKAAYTADRIDSQHAWYSAKALRAERCSVRWSRLTIAVIAVGLAGALARTLGAIDADVLGVASGAAASIAAWTGLRQYRSLAAAYGLTAHELGLVRDSLPHAEDEARWSQIVRDAEQAISREHTLWRARRSPLQLDL